MLSQPFLTYYIFRGLLARLDPYAAQEEESKRQSKAASRRLERVFAEKERDLIEDHEDGEWERPRIQDLGPLTQYEQTIAMEVVAPDEIQVSFDGMSKPVRMMLNRTRC